ncbi:MAG: 5-formyltetrahydrofolate cyclo-ligase [Magnetococcales bacterium]|nr:5-formyltetrahydrofolate cyclo-ligase [Magnetococcales bacterium]
MSEHKQRIRQSILAQRMDMSASQVQRLSATICAHITLSASFGAARYVGIYHPIRNEVDLLSLIVTTGRKASNCIKQFYLPVTDRNSGMLRFCPFDVQTPLVTGAFGVKEPKQQTNTPCLMPEGMVKLDLLLMPLVGFSNTGIRLGYGGGYYDRTLAEKDRSSAEKPLLIGVGYAFQQVDLLYAESHDWPLDGIVTENGLHILS